MLPAIDRQELARLQAELSDIDRRSATRERAPVPQNEAPLSRGNTPEKVVGGPPEPPEPAASPPAAPPAERVPDSTAGLYAEARPPSPPTSPPAPNVGRALRNLQRYLQDSNYDNALGGATDQNADIQFDCEGRRLRSVASPLRRPGPAQLAHPAGRRAGPGTCRHSVHGAAKRSDRRLCASSQPAAIDALTISALNSIKLSNPTAALPPDFPDDRAPFIVTFRYNEPVRETP